MTLVNVDGAFLSLKNYMYCIYDYAITHFLMAFFFIFNVLKWAAFSVFLLKEKNKLTAPVLN